MKDWVFDFKTRLYVFLKSNQVSLMPNDSIDVLSDILELEEFLKSFLNTTMEVADRYGTILLNETFSILQDLQASINRTLLIINDIVSTLRSNIAGIIYYDWKYIIDSFEDIWTTFKAMISSDTQRFFNSVEFQTNVSRYNFSSLFESEIEIIKCNLKKTANKLYSQLIRVFKDYEGFGFRFSAEIKLFGLVYGRFDLEAVHSMDHLGACGRFRSVFELFKGERSFRFFGMLTVRRKLLPFIKMDVGAGFGMAFSIDSDKFLAHYHIQANLLGIRASSDLFVSSSGISFVLEGNLWNYFKARLQVSANHGNEWDRLILHVHGELLGNGDDDSDFHDSYLDVLRKTIKDIGDNANRRLTQAQSALAKAQAGITSAQNWLESKKKDVRALNSKFDGAVRALERAKDKLEDAKGPFRAAIAKLNKAQRNVDNLCRIEHCSRVCVPGLKCKICHTGGWIHVPYPCCHFTSCMISFPNPICAAKNLACRAIRGVAYAALEAAKLFVRVPMLALDAAKLAVSVAEIVVDKSRVVLDIAIAAIDVAKLGLEGAKGVLEAAKLGIEAVKQVLKLGFKVLDMIIDYGLKSLVDLKNCQFDIQISTKDLPVFAVSCQINLFRLGWTEIVFGINFNHPFQSLWQAAKSSVQHIADKNEHRLYSRKKRDVVHESLLKTHKVLRMAREIDPYLQMSDQVLNETIDIVFETPGFENGSVGDDYENRVGVFKAKCERYQKTFSYLNEANAVLYEIANETATTLNSASRMSKELEDFNMENIRRNFTVENTGINLEVAMKDYNLTGDDINSALADANSSLKDDPLLRETASAANISKDLMKNSTSSLTNIRITDQWLLAMNNVTGDYFDRGTCVSFLDCAHYSMAELLDVYYAEDFDNISDIVSTLSSIEDTFLLLVGNSSLTIQSVYNLSKTIGNLLEHLNEMNPLCSSPPVFLSPLQNQTVTRGLDTLISCNVTGDPEPTIWWYENGEMIPDEHDRMLHLRNLTSLERKEYMCIAGNVVANLSSDVMYLNIEGK